jgi:hypothetical protein
MPGHSSAPLLPIRLERPLFGQFVRHVAPLTSQDIESALALQREKGGRLGEILCERKLLTSKQIIEVLRLQARWIAASMQAEMAPSELPYGTFLSLCMPAYNEEANIESTLDAACATLPEFVERFEIVVTDDGSRDDTAELVQNYSQRDPRVRLVQHEGNKGYGAAVTSAMRAAKGDLIMFTDSDGQFSTLDVPQLLLHLTGHDMVIGYRYKRADVGLRKLNAWSWSQLVRLFLGFKIRDLDCAYKLFRREIVERLEMTSSGACINAEIMVQCSQAKLQIKEVPVMHYPRHHGAPTGAAIKVILRAFRELPDLRKYIREPSDLSSVVGTPAATPRPVSPRVLSHARPQNA